MRTEARVGLDRSAHDVYVFRLADDREPRDSRMIRAQKSRTRFNRSYCALQKLYILRICENCRYKIVVNSIVTNCSEEMNDQI